MGRPNRIQFAGACYDIMLQGNNRQTIFMTAQDRRFFLSLLEEYKDRYQLKVHAYCLMSNYAHLLLETAQPNLSKVMQGFNTAYTKNFNQRHGTVGHVFQGRYRALVVDKANCLLEVTCYIHLAPAREGLKDKPWRYPWSSCQAYVGTGDEGSLVDASETLQGLGEDGRSRSAKYLECIQERLGEADSKPETVSKVFVGDDAFAAQVRALCGQTESRETVVRPTAKAILDEVMAKHGMDEERLFGRIQWRQISNVRKEAVYRLWKEAQVGVTEISRMFNRTPSAISQLIRSVETSRVAGN